MKKWMKIAGLLLFFMLPVAVHAEDYTYTTNNGAITITGYTGVGGAVTITNIINGLPVTSIGNYAFQNCSGLTGITIPAGVTNIGDYAFANCSGLTKVYFRGNTPSISFFSFYGVTRATVYRMSGASGWPTVPNTWSGFPTALWPSLAVNGGTGGGTYAIQQQVQITATPVFGKTFVQWTGVIQYITSTTSATTTVSMPSQAITLTAMYTDTYSITVANPQSLIGSSASFSVGASDPKLTYTWRKNGSSIAGATGSTYSISNTGLADAGTYDVIVSNGTGEVATTLPVQLLVTFMPALPSAKYTYDFLGRLITVEHSAVDRVSYIYDNAHNLTYIYPAFEGSDQNGNGIPDAWEIKFFGSTNVVGANTDFNQNGIIDFLEYAFGYDPASLAAPIQCERASTHCDFRLVVMVPNAQWSVKAEQQAGIVMNPESEISSPAQIQQFLIRVKSTCRRIHRFCHRRCWIWQSCWNMPVTGKTSWIGPCNLIIPSLPCVYNETVIDNRFGATTRLTNGHSSWYLKYQRNKYATQLKFVIQVSEDLKSWQTGTNYFEQDGSPADNLDGTETVTLRPLFNMEAFRKFFARIGVQTE